MKCYEMFSKISKISKIKLHRSFSNSRQHCLKVVISGATGKIGETLSLLLKQNSLIKELVLYDVKDPMGLCADLNHVNSSPVVRAYHGKNEISEAFCNANLIIITSGLSRQPKMISRSDLFSKNAELIRDLAFVAGDTAPKCVIVLITNPINSLVPLIRSALKQTKHCNPDNVLGSTSADSMRANTFVARLRCLDPACIRIPVIGGHSDGTMIPLFSQATPEDLCITPEEAQELTKRVTLAGAEVVKAKAGTLGGSAALSVALAASQLCSSILKAFKGKQGIIDTAFVRSPIVPEVKYFASPLLLGKDGIDEHLELCKLNKFEQCLLKSSMEKLNKEIELGEKYTSTDSSCEDDEEKTENTK